MEAAVSFPGVPLGCPVHTARFVRLRMSYPSLSTTEDWAPNDHHKTTNVNMAPLQSVAPICA